MKPGDKKKSLFKFKFGLQHKLMALFLVLSLTPLTIVGFMAYNNWQKTLKNEIGEKLESSAKGILSSLDLLLGNVKQSIQDLASTDTFQDVIADDPDGRITDTLIRFNKKYGHYAGIFCLNDKSVIIASSLPKWIGRDISQAAWVKESIRNREGQFHDLRNSKLTGNLALGFSTPIINYFDQKKVVGVLSGWLDMENIIRPIFYTQIKKETSRNSFVFKLINRNGLIISESNSAGEGESRGDKNLFRREFNFEKFQNSNFSNQASAGVFIEKDSSGKKNLIGFSKSSGFPNLTEFDWVSFVQEKEENAFRPVIELRNQFVGFGIFVGIVVFLFSIFVSRSLNIPTIQNLTQVTREIGKGNLSQKVQTNLKDEIGDLAKAFNSMTTDLENSRKQLIKAKEEAEASNRAKSEFMSGMSHELRTPLNAILGFAQLFFFNSDENLNDSQKVRINEILKAGKHLLELINEVLDLSRIEAGKITLSLEAVGLQEILDEVISIILPLAEQKGIHITFPEAQDSDLTVTADRIRLKQVLLNLFSNAVKYNIEGGSVTLKAEKTKDDKVVVHITDTGIGIPQEKLNSIFEPFNRLGAENSEIEGTGIGLCITKRLIELMAGEIFVESHLGEGSRFSIELPKGKKLELLEAKHEKYSVPSLPVITGDQKYTLLYVEDNPANLLLVKQLLDNRQDIHLLTAPEAQLGIDLALSHQPDLILMDINLPGMDGVTALKRLKQNKKTSEIPIIAVSANAMESDINCAMKAGFDAYITKPLVIESFVETIQKFLIQKTIRQ